MYLARGAQIFYFHPETHTEEVFITIHPTEDCSQSVEQQAVALAKLLNDEE